MKEPEAYSGREQTYLKHFFLERYLERVAYNIGSGGDFVYVDGFSGPWRSQDEAFEDTSFMVAINKLRTVRAALAARGQRPAIRCLFVEKDPKAFAELTRATEGVKDIEVRVVNDKFEAALPEIVDFVGRSFALTFIDPTGWSGFALQRIAPLLRMRGEVLINFMFEHINRFLTDERSATASTFDELFGGPGWDDVVDEGEGAILDFYQERLKGVCAFDYATRTRVSMPLRDRTYFHLVYATRHPKGLVEFRGVEKKLRTEQRDVLADAKQSSRIERTGQAEFFRDADVGPGLLSFEEEELRNHARARNLVLSALDGRTPLRYERIAPAMHELPTVNESAAKHIIRALHDEGRLQIEGLQGKQRLPRSGCRLVVRG